MSAVTAALISNTPTFHHRERVCVCVCEREEWSSCYNPTSRVGHSFLGPTFMLYMILVLLIM